MRPWFVAPLVAAVAAATGAEAASAIPGLRVVSADAAGLTLEFRLPGLSLKPAGGMTRPRRTADPAARRRRHARR